MKKTRLLPLVLVLIMSVIVYFVFGIDQLLRTPKARPYVSVTDFSAEYNADEDIKKALEIYKASEQKAVVLRSDAAATTKQVAITFDGLTERSVVQRVLDVLKRNGVTATFFIDGLQASEDPQNVSNVAKAGHSIQNYSFSGSRNMQILSADKLISDFCRAQKVINVTAGVTPKYLKCNDSYYTDTVLRAAKACGFDVVVQNNVFLNAVAINTAGNADEVVKSLPPGSIISVKLMPFPETIQPEKTVTDVRPAVDKKPGLKELPKPSSSGNANIITALERLITSLKKEGYQFILIEDMPVPKAAEPAAPATGTQQSSAVRKAASLLEEAKDAFLGIFSVKTAYAEERRKLAEELRYVYTTEQALSYTFGGINKTNGAVVDKVLAQLDSMGIKATFFVFEVEMDRFPAVVKKIISRGHEIGLGINPVKGETYGQTRQNIVNGLSKLKSKFGVTTKLVKQPWGAVTDDAKAAVASLDCHLISQSINIIQTKHKSGVPADTIIDETFGRFRHSLARGSIVFFRMDFYSNPNVLYDLMRAVKRRKIDNIAFVTPYDNPVNNRANDSYYLIKPIGQIMANKSYSYKYPVNLEDVPENLRYVRPLPAMAKNGFMNEVSKRYVGHYDVTYEDRQIGFSKIEDRRLDKRGVVNTDENVIFFTFDDWGTDAPINKLLYVFRKHNTKTTFFVITRSVLENKNLLRSIAEEGHEIGSHSDQHVPMAVRDPVTRKQKPGQPIETHYADVAKSYEILRDVVGDVVLDGRPSLTRIYRPPTLAISKEGMEALFQAGYEFIVNGSASSYDYKSETVTELVETVMSEIYDRKGNLKKGIVIVFHMSDNSIYTAMAVDLLLTANAAKADSDPTKFKVGLLSDYLNDDYDQMKYTRPKKTRLQ